jgi:O-antigen ligase
VIGAAITTVFITPFYSFDSLNAPRLIPLTIFGVIGALFLFHFRNELNANAYRKVLVASAGFITWMIFSLFASRINLAQGFYGLSRRHTGLLTYFMIISLMMVAVLASNRIFLRKLTSLLLWLGFVSSIYGAFQFMGVDPINWVNTNSPVISIFGNPNFHSAFMGITATASLAMTLEKGTKHRTRIFLFVTIFLAVLNIFYSKSWQGYFVLFAGALVVFNVNAEIRMKTRGLKIIPLVFTVLTLLIVTLDILQKVPWNSFFYKESVSYRGDFWRAAAKMTMNNPVFGVGPDGFVDKYRQSRDLKAALRPESNQITDSAHNLFLDLSSTGGVPLLLIYIFLVGLTLISATRVIHKDKDIDTAFVAIFASWVACLTQSTISVNQIVLSMWTWILMGAIIGYDLNSRHIPKFRTLRQTTIKLSISAGLVLGLSLTLPLVTSDANFRSAIESGDPYTIQKSAKERPLSIDRMIYAARILQEGNYPELSIEIVREAIAFNPQSFIAWAELSIQKNASTQERNLAKYRLKTLDPWNPKLK